MGRKSILLTHLKCLYFFYLNIVTIIFPRICPMSDDTRQNRSKRNKMRQDIKLLIIATRQFKTPYLCPFPAIIHHSSSTVPGGLLVRSYITRFTPLTSLMMRLMTFWRTANGISEASAVMKSTVSTARRTTA